MLVFWEYTLAHKKCSICQFFTGQERMTLPFIPNHNCNSNWRHNFFILLVQSYDHTCIAMCNNNGNWIRHNFNNFDSHRLQQSHMEPGIASDMLRDLQTHVYEVKTLHGCRDSTVIARKRPDFKDLQKKMTQ